MLISNVLNQCPWQFKLLSSSSIQSRLDSVQMSPEEASRFPNCADDPIAAANFLRIRNQIVSGGWEEGE